MVVIKNCPNLSTSHYADGRIIEDEWFELEDKTVEVCYPDEFYVEVRDNVWVEQDDGTTIEKILEVIEIQDDIGIIEYEKD